MLLIYPRYNVLIFHDFTGVFLFPSSGSKMYHTNVLEISQKPMIFVLVKKYECKPYALVEQKPVDKFEKYKKQLKPVVEWKKHQADLQERGMEIKQSLSFTAERRSTLFF